MAFGTGHIINGDYGDFIPEMWSDEVIGAYKASQIIANHVTRINHKGKKGDTMHIPSPSRGSANAKTAETIVTFNNPASSVVNLSIDKHYEYSFLYEDLMSLQGMDSLRKFYTDDAGYALATQVDQDLFILAAIGSAGGATQFEEAVIGSDGSTLWSGTANSNSGNAAALSDAGIRNMIQTMDDDDVPMGNRVLIVPPVEKNNILGIARFTEQAFTGDGNAIRTGMIANLYGIPVYVTTNCPWVHTDSGDGDDFFDFSSSNASTGTDATGESVTIGAGGAAVGRVGMLLHKEAFALIEAQSVRSQVQYKQEYLADLFTADTVYGKGVLRNEGCVPFIVED